MIAIDEQGVARAVLGFLPSTGRGIDRQNPWYHVAYRARSPGGGVFVALRGGVFDLVECFPQAPDHAGPANLQVLLPEAGNSYFGIWDTDTDAEHPAMTREIFGCTHKDLLAIARSVARVRPPRDNEFGFLREPEFPRVSSSHLGNDCDLTGAYIPARFPYLSFHGASFARSHVSLPGFYSFLAMAHELGPLTKIFRDEGVPVAALDHIFGLRRATPGPLDAPRRRDWVGPDLPEERAGVEAINPASVRGRGR